MFQSLNVPGQAGMVIGRGFNTLTGQVAGQEALTITRSLPHGQIAAVLGTLRRIGLDRLLYLVAALALLIGTAHASDYTGLIAAEGLRFSTGTSPARVSVSVASLVTPCAVKNFYAYESAASGLAGLWTTALIQARIHDRTVRIVGTGQCDNFGIERILFIDLR